MYYHKLPNAAACKITVTNTATLLSSLIATAASASTFAFEVGANALDIIPEDGDIRILFDGNTPTASNGVLLKSGGFYAFRGIPIHKMRLIRVSGNVVCSIQVGRAEQYEATAASVPASVGTVSISGDVTVDSEFPAAAAASDNFANPTTTSVMAMNMGWDGSAWDRLPGTAADGLLVNLGANNDVVLTNDSLIGPGDPVVDSYTSVAINLAAGNNQQLVAAPGANKQIWVYSIAFTVNVAGTVSFQDEDDTAITGIMPFGITGGMAIAQSGNFAMPIWKVATNKALEVDIVTSELDGYLTYAIVSV